MWNGRHQLTFLALSAFALSGCFAQTAQVVTEQLPNPNVPSPCQINPDQFGSFIGRVGSLPVHIHMDVDFEAPGFEKRKDAVMWHAIWDAATEWNEFGKQALGTPLFVLGRIEHDTPGHPGAKISSVDQFQDFCKKYPDRTGLTVLREDSNTHWAVLGKGDPESQFSPALTYPCSFGSKSEPARELMVLNTSDASKFNVADRAVWKAIMIHELGHALGLNHSCQPGSGNAAYAGCDALGPKHPYSQSAMFPSASFDDPSMLKSKLTENDKLRACYLYRKALKTMSPEAVSAGPADHSVKTLPESGGSVPLKPAAGGAFGGP